MFGDMLGEAAKLLGSAAPDQVQAAAADHVGAMDPGDLAGHLAGMLPNMPAGARSQLGQAVLGALNRNGTSEDAVQAAGVPTDAAKAGDEGAVGALLQHAAADPSSLKDAAISYITNNPQIVQQYAPALLRGVLARLGAA